MKEMKFITANIYLEINNATLYGPTIATYFEMLTKTFYLIKESSHGEDWTFGYLNDKTFIPIVALPKPKHMNVKIFINEVLNGGIGSW